MQPKVLGSLQTHETGISSLKTRVREVEQDTGTYSEHASSPDANGIFTIVEYKRADGTLYMKSTLSNPDVDGNYQTVTWNYYDTPGTTIVETKTWSFTYDSLGNITNKAVL